MRRKDSLDAKGEICQGMYYPDAFSVKSILAKRCVHTWEDPEIYQIGTVNQANHNDWPKEIPPKYPIKVASNSHEGETQRLSLPESARVSMHTHCTLFPPNKYLTCLTTLHLCRNSFLQSRRTSTSSLTSGQDLVLSLQ